MKNFTHPEYEDQVLNEHLCSLARALVVAANELAHLNISFDDAISQAWTMLQNPPVEAISGGDLAARLDPQRLMLLIASVSQISGRSIDNLMQSIFRAHPGVPCEYRFGQIFSIQALVSFRQVVAHGEESGNSLLIPEFVVDDVAGGAAFYAVKKHDCIAGTISLRLDDSSKNLHIQVERVGGVDNVDASPELVQLAQSLADSWAAAHQLECWFGYARHCAEWRRLASDSA